MIVHRRRWCTAWVGIVTAILTGGLVWVAFKLQGSDRLATLPLLFTSIHLTLTLLFNYTTATVNEDGVFIREGVIPAGFRDWRVTRADVAAVYWRHNFRGHRSGEESHWAVVVASRSGSWMDLPARFESEMAAQQEAYRIGKVLGMGVGRGAGGAPPRPDRRVLWALLYWFGLVGICFLWPAFLL
jgi:hypothetical protein